MPRTRPSSRWRQSSTTSTAPAAGSGTTRSSRPCTMARALPVRVSALLYEALDVACAVARRTAGAVDPTVGNAMGALGYDRDLQEVLARPLPAMPQVLGPVAGYAHVHLHPDSRTARIPRGVRLDLGSTAKASRRRPRRGRASPARSTDRHWSAWAATSPSPGRPSPAVGPSGSPTSRRLPRPPCDQVVAIHRGGLASSAPGARTLDGRKPERQPHRRPVDG